MISVDASATLNNMRKASAKGRARRSKAGRSVTVPTLNKDLALRLRGSAVRRPTLKSREINGTLLVEIERALRHPGVNRKSVFTDTGVSSYSVDPHNPQRFVRERADGSKTVGRFVKGHFRPIPTK
jgi:hypothetical protein